MDSIKQMLITVNLINLTTNTIIASNSIFCWCIIGFFNVLHCTSGKGFVVVLITKVAFVKIYEQFLN